MRTHSINFFYLIRLNKYFLILFIIIIALSSISVPIKNYYDPSSTSTHNKKDILRIDNEQIVQKLVDWYQRSEGHTEYFAPDGIHLENSGVEALTDEILKNMKKK